MDLIPLLIYIITLLIAESNAIRWHLEPNTQKCLREELQSNVLVTGEYEVSEAPGQRVDYSIRDSKGHILSQKTDINHGKFSFVTETYDAFEVCFASHVPPSMRGHRQEIHLIMKRGIEAKSYEGIGEAAKLKPLEVELRRLEDLSEDIVKDFAIMRKAEEDMRDTNESTNRRVLWFSVFSMACLCGLALWQVIYLRKFFQAKKLIE